MSPHIVETLDERIIDITEYAEEFSSSYKMLPEFKLTYDLERRSQLEVEGVKIESIKGMPLEDLFHKIITPFKGLDECVDFDKLQVKVAEPATEEFKQAVDIVDFYYNIAFYRDIGPVDKIARDKYSDLPTTRTLVVTQEIGGRSFVLATARIIWGDHLEMFDLFEPMEGQMWPHEFDNTFNPDEISISGEFGRLAFNQVFNTSMTNFDRGDKYLSLIIRGGMARYIWRGGMTIMRDDVGVNNVLAILPRKVQHFLEYSGIPFKMMQGIEKSDSDYAKNIRKDYPRYWEQDPRVYISADKLEAPQIQWNKIYK